MSEEFHKISRLFRKLRRARLWQFPENGKKLDAPMTQGVYVIYSPQEEVLHVGRTTRASKGIKQRLGNHLSGRSSFVRLYLKGDSKRLRNGCSFRFVEVNDARQRALLEAYAAGKLCPAHIGLGIKTKKSN